MSLPPPSPAEDPASAPRPGTGLDAIRERLCADLIERWNRGERVPVEAYLRQHPELESGECALELILTEAVLRQERGESAPMEEYIWRFPRFEDSLRRHFLLMANLSADTVTRAPTVASPRVSVALGSAVPTVPGFDIIEQIGRGGMGVVYKAREVSLGRHVALKLLRDDHTAAPDRLARFLREARTASALNHPCICTVHSLNERDGRPYIVMELIEGVTLRALIGRNSGPDEVARIISKAAQALAAAHAAGVVHRDIKPENVMIRNDGHVKVVDFGLARLLPEGLLADEGSATDPGTIAGTLTYMSPEQTRNEPASSASDVFSLGIVAYELATGRHPFAVGSALETLNAVASTPAIPPAQIAPGLPHDFDELVLQMLEKDPRLRPTAAEVGAALGRMTGARIVHAADAPLASPLTTVGRESQQAEIWSAFEVAERGNGLLLCVTGEPGIGKTTLVENWLRELTASQRAVGIGRGRCSERLAGTGSYLPVLEAVEGLLRGEAGSLAARLMRDLAATWYAQVAPFQGETPGDVPGTRGESSTLERMKREFLAFVTVIGRQKPLVLFFDDLHWADASTLDLLAWLGRHTAGLRVLIVATYRPTEMLATQSPFLTVALELKRHGACRDLPLTFLGLGDVERYLALLYPGHGFPADFAAGLHAKTEGNPLFLVELVHHLQDLGVIAEREGWWRLARDLPDLQQELPVSVRSLIQQQIDQIDESDLRLLSVGSVQGYEFDAAVVSSVLARDAAEVEERLERLDRGQGLVRLVREHEFPDGTLTLRYRFVHVLYQNSLYGLILPARRKQWCAAVAEALLDLHRGQRELPASELALLFENARDWLRAAHYFSRAARSPLRLHAHREAAMLARRGLEMLSRLPDSPARAHEEVPLQFALGIALQPTEGFAAPDVVEAYRRARELRQVDFEISHRSPLLWGLWSFHLIRGEHHAAREIAEELYALAQGQTDPLIALPAHHSMGYTLMMLGHPAQAWEHLGRVVPAETQAVYGRDLGIPFRAHGSIVLWLLGRGDQAAQRIREVVAIARERLELYSLAIALLNAAKIYQLRQDVETTAQFANALLTLTQEQDFPHWNAAGTVLAGWAMARQGRWQDGVARIRQGIDAYRAAGAAMIQPHFLGLLAEALERGGLYDDGLEAVDQALVLTDETGESYFQAELYRLRGELLLKQSGTRDRAADAQTCFTQALAIAARQQSLSFELRAAISAARLAHREGQLDGARSILEPVLSRMTEGFESVDCRDAARLLAQMT